MHILKINEIIIILNIYHIKPKVHVKKFTFALGFFSFYPEILDFGQLGLAPPLVIKSEHTKLYAGYGCLVLEIYLKDED